MSRRHTMAVANNPADLFAVETPLGVSVRQLLVLVERCGQILWIEPSAPRRRACSELLAAGTVWGGPVEAAFARREARFGMDGIVGNALGFDAPPSADALAARLGSFSLRRLLDGSTNAPMLVVNGADDVHVPRHDALVFEGRAATEVRLIPDAGHCATTKLPEVLTLVVEWIRTTLS